MSIYDGYRLANSTAIPTFQGSAGDDFVKVGMYKQGQYDVAQQGLIKQAGDADAIQSTLNPEAAQELRQDVQGKISAISKNGDLENALPQVQALGQHFANRAREIEAPDRQLSAYRESLENKDLNLTPDQKQGLLSMSVAGYKKVSKNAQGQYQGSFSGVAPAKNIDVNEWVDKRLKDIAVSKQGDSYERDSQDGMWIVKNGHRVEYLGKEQINNVLKNAAANDPEYQAFKNMQGAIAGHHASQVNPWTLPDKLEDGSPNTLKSDATVAAAKYGVSFNAAYKAVVEQTTKDHIDAAVSGYGVGKYARKNIETENSKTANPYTLKDWDTKDDGSSGLLVVQGPDSKLTNDEKDFEKLSQNNRDAADNLTGLRNSANKLQNDLNNKNLSAATRTQKQSDLQNIQGRIDGAQQQFNRAQDIMNYSKDQTARKWGYDDYADLLKKKSVGLDKVVSQIYPSGVVSSSGRKISKDELVAAAADNRIRPITQSNSGGVGGGGTSVTGSKVTLKDGTTVEIPGGSGAALNNAVEKSLQNESKDISNFNDDVNKSHAENVKDFATQSTSISLPESFAKTATELIKVNKDGVKFSKPGQISSTTAPDNFRILAAGTAGTGGDTKLQAEELDKDGKPTGNTFDVTLTNSNIAEKLSRQMGASKEPESRQIADMLSSGSGARKLMSQIPGNSVSVGKVKSGDEVMDAEIKITRHTDKSISYDLVDSKTGKVLKSTNTIQEAGSWVDDIQGKETYANGKKTLVIDKGRTKDQ